MADHNVPATREEKEDLYEKRDYKVVKSNKIIQQSRYALTMREQKAVAYICSKIKPLSDEEKRLGPQCWPLEYEFSILDYCKVCGINGDSGTIYAELKKVLKSLRDKSVWITNMDGSETTVAWLSSVTTSKKNGTVICKIDPKMAPYLYDLRDRFTQYDLFEILAMKSTYSIRIFELLRSYAWQKKVQFKIDDFRHLLMIDTIKSYTSNFKALREKVLEPAIKEINEYTYLHVEYSTKLQNRKVTDLIFTIEEKPDVNRRDPGNSRIGTMSKVIDQLDKKKT